MSLPIRPRASTPRRVLIIVENLPVPFDRRVWQEASTLHKHGYDVSVICPKGPGYERGHEIIDGIAIYRHPLPFQARRWYGYLAEYGAALFFQFLLAWRIQLTRGFDAVHACNPPDVIFLVGGFFKLFLRKRFLFDHHDLSPELYEAKMGKRGALWRVLLACERLTYRTADVSIATNESYRQTAIERGGMDPARVFVVRSGPDLDRLRQRPPDESLKQGRPFLVTYLGIMGAQDGVDLLLRVAHFLVREMHREDVQFLLVGGGTELGRMQELSEQLGVEDHVTFTGLLPPDSELLMTALSTTDVGVSPDPPSAMNDKSTMNKVLEYMAFGKPLVQFNLTEGRASAGEAALYANDGDPRDLARKITALLDDEPLRRQMGDHGRERIETELGWEHQQRSLLAAYETLLSPPEPSARPRAGTEPRGG